MEDFVLVVRPDGKVIEYIREDGPDQYTQIWENVKHFLRDHHYHDSMSDQPFVQNFIRTIRSVSKSLSQPTA